MSRNTKNYVSAQPGWCVITADCDDSLKIKRTYCLEVVVEEVVEDELDGDPYVRVVHVPANAATYEDFEDEGTSHRCPDWGLPDTAERTCTRGADFIGKPGARAHRLGGPHG